jgi:hypothetical protein
VGTHYRIPAREFERFRGALMGAMITGVSADLSGLAVTWSAHVEAEADRHAHGSPCRSPL